MRAGLRSGRVIVGLSSSCSVSYTPAVGGGHTISGTYSGDTTHLSSAGSVVVTALNHSTSPGGTCSPAPVPVASPTTSTGTATDSTPGTTNTPNGLVSLAGTRCRAP